MSDLLIMEDVVGRWDHMAIIEEKCDMVGVVDNFVAKEKKVAFFGLLANTFLENPIINKKAFNETLMALWRIEKGLTITEVKRYIFLFTFGVFTEYKGVIERFYRFFFCLLENGN